MVYQPAYFSTSVGIAPNRIVSDITFATRFVGFLSDIQVADAMSYDELEYLKYVAKKLLDYQLATITDEDEKEYFENLK